MKFKQFPNEKQLDMMDCGPACLKIIAKFYGKYYSLQHFRDKCGLTREGVSFLDLSYAAEDIGLRTLSIKSSLEDLYLKVPLPCIIHWSNSHYIIVYKVTKTRVYVSDPAKGLVEYSHNEFQRKWYKPRENKGVLLAIEPQADFMQREGSQKIATRKSLQNILGYFTPYKKS